MKKYLGWFLSFAIAGLLIFGSASGKFTDWDGKAEMFGKFGYTVETMYNIGFVEVAAAILFIIPWTSFLGALLLTAYLGGAAATHIRIGDPFQMPVIIGVIVWIALALRNPAIIPFILGKK